MLSTEELKQEHRVIERMLVIVETASAREKAGIELPPEFFPRVVYFVRNFADRCHHGKEEDNLFPMMERRGVPKQGGPVAVMLVEHEQGREYVKNMEEAGKRYSDGDAAALRVALDNALGYASLLRNHIQKEDNILYLLADRVLTEGDDRELVQKFEEVENERIGVGKHREFLQMVEQLEKEMGIKPPAQSASHHPD